MAYIPKDTNPKKENRNMPSANPTDYSRRSWDQWRGMLNTRDASVASYSTPFVGNFVTGKKEQVPAPYFIGIELECSYYRFSTLQKAAELCDKYLGQFSYIFKSDSSIGGHRSCEIVSSPRSLMAWEQVNLKELTKGLISNGWRSWDTTTTGLHLHFSSFEEEDRRLDYGLDHRVRRLLLHFCVANAAELRILSRREESQMRYAVLHSSTQDYLRGNRASAVNLSNSRTVEFRLPRGTLNSESILAYIQFFSGIYSVAHQMALGIDRNYVYTQDTDLRISSAPFTWDKVVEWLQTNKKKEALKLLKQLKILAKLPPRAQKAGKEEEPRPTEYRAMLLGRITKDTKRAGRMVKLSSKLGQDQQKIIKSVGKIKNDLFGGGHSSYPVEDLKQYFKHVKVPEDVEATLKNLEKKISRISRLREKLNDKINHSTSEMRDIREELAYLMGTPSMPATHQSVYDAIEENGGQRDILLNYI